MPLDQITRARRAWTELGVLAPLRWGATHERLAAQPVFKACTRKEIRTLAQAGDECVVPKGTVLCREERIGYWMFVVTGGAIQLSQKGRPVATMGAGSHFGDVAILGFGPQPVTAEAVEDSTVFVLGRRSVLDLTAVMTSLQTGLYPDLVAGGFLEKVRVLRSAGTAEWQAMPRRTRAEVALAAGKDAERLPPSFYAFPARRISLAPTGTSVPSPFAFVLGGTREPTDGGLRLHPAAPPFDRRIVAATAAAAAAALLAVLLLYHPDTLIVRPSATVDISADVEIEVPASSTIRPHRPRGRYIATAVDIEETNLLGLGLALLRGDATVHEDHRASEDDAKAGRDLYRQSQRTAADLIAGDVGLAPRQVTVHFRDRHLSGPSAGLIYALLLADMTDRVHVESGRVVAATGGLAGDGTVQPVGFVDVKAKVARRVHAAVFLVPSAAEDGNRRTTRGATPVRTLAEAIAALSA